MKTAKLLINVFAFTVLFFDYAVAMTPPEPVGTRRFLQIYAGQSPTGSYPTLESVWRTAVMWTGRT